MASGAMARVGTPTALEPDDHGRPAVHRAGDARRRAVSDVVPAVVSFGRQGHRSGIRPALHPRRPIHIPVPAPVADLVGRLGGGGPRLPAVRHHHTVCQAGPGSAHFRLHGRLLRGVRQCGILRRSVGPRAGIFDRGIYRGIGDVLGLESAEAALGVPRAAGDRARDPGTLPRRLAGTPAPAVVDGWDLRPVPADRARPGDTILQALVECHAVRAQDARPWHGVLRRVVLYGAVRGVRRGEPKPFRVLDLKVYPENVLMAHGIQQVLGYQGNELRYYDELLGGRPGTQNGGRYLLTSTKLWDLLAVRFLLISDTVRVPGYHKVLGPVETAAGSRGYVYEADTAPPYARVVPAALKLEDDSLVPPTLADPRMTGYDRVVLLPPRAPVNPPPLRSLPAPSASR